MLCVLPKNPVTPILTLLDTLLYCSHYVYVFGKMLVVNLNYLLSSLLQLLLDFWTRSANNLHATHAHCSFHWRLPVAELFVHIRNSLCYPHVLFLASALTAGFSCMKRFSNSLYKLSAQWEVLLFYCIWGNWLFPQEIRQNSCLLYFLIFSLWQKSKGISPRGYEHSRNIFLFVCLFYFQLQPFH